MFQKVEKDGCIFQISQPLMLAYFIMKKFKQHGYSNFTFARNYFKQTLILQQGTESPHCCSICISSWSKIVHSCAECPHIVAPYVFPVGLRSYIAVQNVPTLLLHMCFQLIWDHTFLCRMSTHCFIICISSGPGLLQKHARFPPVLGSGRSRPPGASHVLRHVHHAHDTHSYEHRHHHVNQHCNAVPTSQLQRSMPCVWEPETTGKVRFKETVPTIN